MRIEQLEKMLRRQVRAHASKRIINN